MKQKRARRSPDEEALLEAEFFGDDRAASVHLGREHGAYQLRLLINPSLAAHSDVRQEFNELGAAIAAEALGGQAIVVHLCDDHFRTLASWRIERQRS
ncbi:MAG: hypothetical protein ABW020_09925 [Candidatus Rokuibacteriota bacterium]